MDEAGLTGRLDACLLTDAEMALGEAVWKATFPDPFLEWGIAEVAPDSAPADGTATA